MSFFPKAPLIAGIITTPHSFLVALIKKKREGFDIISLEEWPLNTNCKDKLPRDALLVSALDTRSVLIRPLELPLKKEKDIESAYSFQAEPLLPFPLENGVIQKITVRQHAEGSLLTILAAKKDHVESHIAALKEKGLAPAAVTSIGFALSCLSLLLPPSFEPQIWMEWRENEGTVALIEGGKLLTARACEKEGAEIQKSIAAISSVYKNKKIETIYLIAEGEDTLEMVRECTQKNVVALKLDCTGESDLKKYGVPLGLALSACEKHFPDFLPKEQKVLQSFKRLKKPLVTYFALAFLFFVTLTAIEKEALKKRENTLLNRASLVFHERSSSAQELEEKLEKYQQEIAKIPDIFQLYPQVPKVRDLLAHFSSEMGSGIEIEELHYMMVERPDFDRKNEKYKVVVEMTFTCSSPEDASRFRDMLSSSSLVDGKKEIQWISNKGKYKISFNLKDKTRYA